MAYTVSISPGSFSFEARPQESVLDAALSSGLSFPHSCREGNCGTCLGRVLHGEISYPEGLPLGLMGSDHEAGWALFCMAHAKSDLELEVKEVSDTSPPEFYQTQIAKVLDIEKLTEDTLNMTLLIAGSQKPWEPGSALTILIDGEQYRYMPRPQPAAADVGTTTLMLTLYIERENNLFSLLAFNELQVGALLRIIRD